MFAFAFTRHSTICKLPSRDALCNAVLSFCKITHVAIGYICDNNNNAQDIHVYVHNMFVRSGQTEHSFVTKLSVSGYICIYVCK